MTPDTTQNAHINIKRKIQRECARPLQFARRLLVTLFERNRAVDPVAQLDREQKMILESYTSKRVHIVNDDAGGV